MNVDHLTLGGYKTIEGFSSYLVNNKGFIYSKKSNKFLKSPTNKTGFSTVTIYSNEGVRRTFLIHRLVAEHFIDNPNKYNWVRHKDGNKQNNQYSNLEYCKFDTIFKIRKNRKKRYPRISIERRIDAFWSYFKDFTRERFTKLYKANPRAIELAVIQVLYAYVDDLKESQLIYFKYCEGATYEEMNNHGLTSYRVRTSIYRSRKSIIKIIEKYKGKVIFPQLEFNTHP